VPQFGGGIGAIPTAVAHIRIFRVTRTGPDGPQRRDHAPRLFHINDLIASAMKIPARNMLDGLDAGRITSAANRHNRSPFVGVSRRQTPHTEATRRCARQINAPPIHSIIPEDFFQDSHDPLAILRIGLPRTRFGLRKEDEHVERILPFFDKWPRPIGRWLHPIPTPRTVAVQIYQKWIRPISLVLRRDEERVFPLVILRVHINA
jgi:hypothetical protein